VQLIDDTMQLMLNVNTDGDYNILVVADRKDSVAVDEYNAFGVEYQETQN
jgi:hypothetical protein